MLFDFLNVGAVTLELWGLFCLIGLVAFLYASVGHGGASGYLAVLSFFGFSHQEMATTALILNILVAGLSFYAYQKERYFSWRLTWPFLLLSIPMAFVGGLIHISPQHYFFLLALTLLFAAFRLALPSQADSNNHVAGTKTDSLIIKNPACLVPLPSSLLAGGAIGFLSGIVGVGGGIFLSPLMLLARWASIKTVSATSALFIIVNAFAGLLGRFSTGRLVVGDVWLFLLPALIGGALGAYYGAAQFSNLMLRRLLSVVLILAAFKLFLPYFK